MRLRINSFRDGLYGRPVYFLEKRRSFLGIRFWSEVAFPATRGDTPACAEAYAVELRRGMPAPREV